METIIFGQWWRSHQSLAMQRFTYFSDSVLRLGKMNENPQSNYAWQDRLTWFQKFTRNTELWTKLMVSRWNSSGIFSQDSPHCSLSVNPRVIDKIERRTRQFHWTDYLHVDIQRHLMGSKDNEKECESSAQLVSLYAKRFSPGQWSFLGPGSEKKWYSTHESKPQGAWNRVAELMMIKFGESEHQVFRATSPLSRGTLKSKGGGKYQYTFALTRERLKLFFAQLFLWISSVFTEQSQICVKNAKLAMSEQGDLLWQDNLTHCLCQVWWRHTYLWPVILRKKKRSIAKKPGTNWKVIRTRSSD